MRTASSNRITGSLVVFAAVVLAMGCSDPLRPAEIAGTYVLRAINGDSLPAVIGRGDPSAPSTVVADTLRLSSDGRGSLVRVEDVVVNGDTGQMVRVRSEDLLHFRTSENRIELTFDCPPNALMLCAPGPHMTARITAGGLRADRLLGQLVQQLAYAHVE